MPLYFDGPSKIGFISAALTMWFRFQEKKLKTINFIRETLTKESEHNGTMNSNAMMFSSNMMFNCVDSLQFNDCVCVCASVILNIIQF